MLRSFRNVLPPFRAALTSATLLFGLLLWLPGLTLTASAAVSPAPDFRGETIYFLITTRFFDGDPSNNFYNRDRIQPGDPHWRGDFKGLIQQLDYIKDLGFTAIWITPPVENRSGLDYHGYHAYDWTRIDPRLESPDATYQDLIDAVHAHGMKLIQDVVINHSSNYGIRGKVWNDHLPIKYFRPVGGSITPPYTVNLGNYLAPFHEDNDNPLAPDWFRSRQTTDADGVEPLTDPSTGLTLEQFRSRPDRFFNTDVRRLDPEWYHSDGYIAGGDWENQYSLQHKSIAGDCLDLNTGNPAVKAYLTDAIGHYLDMGVDALRLDTAKHVERDELLGYVANWQARKPGLFVFGEVLVKGLGLGDLGGGDNGPSEIRPWWYTRTGHDPRQPLAGGDSGFSVLDFPLFSTFRDNITRGNFNGLAGVFANDWIYGDATKLVTFFQNHDVGPDNDFKYRFAGDAATAAVAYNLLWTARGIPTLYAGEEIQFMLGAPQDVSGEHDTLASTGRAYFGGHLTRDELPRTQAHPLYQHIKRLNLLRRQLPALQRAPMSQVVESSGGLSFIRALPEDGKGSYVVVGLAAQAATDFRVAPVRNGTYTDAVSGAVRVVTDQTLTFSVAGSSIGLWVLAGAGKIGEDSVYLRPVGR